MAPGNGADGAGALFGCAYCTEAFPEKHELEVHQKMIHPDKPFASVPASMPEREIGLMHKAPTAAISNSIPLSEVARHCIPEDCWVAINGKVYDVTEFMDRHPGGPTIVMSWAGKEASKIFNDVHKGVKIEQYLRPEACVGNLGVDENLMSDEHWHILRKVRIAEIKEYMAGLAAFAPPKASNIALLLADKGLDKELRAKLQTLETQKRVALDREDYAKAAEIMKGAEDLLGEAQVKLAPRYETSSGFPLSEVARHNKPHDCWVAIKGQVYDLTEFLIHHPEQRNPVLAWAGRDATAIWDKIPGRFPSSTWMEFYGRPEFIMGEVAAEAPLDAKEEQLRQLQEELRRLEGPSEEDVQAAKAAATARAAASLGEAAKMSEADRFPRLREVAAPKELPFFTRAEVAKHSGPPGGPPGTEPYMILHNRVYNLTPLLGLHPGGDELLLSRAGTDATKDFELFEHSEKARVRRDQELLVGEVVPGEHADWTAEAGAAEVVEGEKPSELARYLRYKAADVGIVLAALYGYWAFQKRKPLSHLMYSRGLRHLHLIMAVGMFGSLASAQAAVRSEGLAKKWYLAVHKQTGVAMFLALFVRLYYRLTSGIPPRFPGNPIVQFVESQSLRAFYALMFVLPASGMANEYYLKWAPGSEKTGVKGDDERNERLAKQAITAHQRLGKFFQFVWLPFHLGYTSAYHYSRGRGVLRKVSPFI